MKGATKDDPTDAALGVPGGCELYRERMTVARFSIRNSPQTTIMDRWVNIQALTSEAGGIGGKGRDAWHTTLAALL